MCWHHSQKGIILPEKFIHIFEKNGFIIRLGEYIWEKICLLLRKWLAMELAPVPLSVNLSHIDIYDQRRARTRHVLDTGPQQNRGHLSDGIGQRSHNTLRQPLYQKLYGFGGEEKMDRAPYNREISYLHPQDRERVTKLLYALKISRGDTERFTVLYAASLRKLGLYRRRACRRHCHLGQFHSADFLFFFLDGQYVVSSKSQSISLILSWHDVGQMGLPILKLFSGQCRESFSGTLSEQHLCYLQQKKQINP